MESTPFNDIRTIWFREDQPHEQNDYEMLLERYAVPLMARSIKNYPNLWNPDQEKFEFRTHKNVNPNKTMFDFVSPSKMSERVDGHYCIIKPLPKFMQDFLKETCEPYGPIVEVKVVKAKSDGEIIGVVDFLKAEDAKRAAKAINGSKVEDVELAARYLCKKKRTRALDLMIKKQLQSAAEQKKPQKKSTKLPLSEMEILNDLCQQWISFSEVHGCPISLETLIWNLSNTKASPPTRLHEPIAPAVELNDDIVKVLSELDKILKF